MGFRFREVGFVEKRVDEISSYENPLEKQPVLTISQSEGILSDDLKGNSTGVTSGELMSLGDPFCVSCGSPPPLTSERLCETCFSERFTLATIPPHIHLTTCSDCESLLGLGGWQKIEKTEILEVVLKEETIINERAQSPSVEFIPKPLDERNEEVTIIINADVEGIPFQEVIKTIVRSLKGLCPNCSRRAGDYFEATVQLRSSGRELTQEEVEEMRSTLDTMIAENQEDPLFFINRESDVIGGKDIVLGSKSLARIWGKRLVSLWGGGLKESQTVVGRKDGVDITRLTLLYRKPALERGDVVRFRGDYWLVGPNTGKGLILEHLYKKHRMGVSWRDAESAVVEIQRGEQIVVDILARDTSAAEFLDPNDWKMRVVALPWSDDGITNKLLIGRLEDKWIAIPHIWEEE